MKKILEEVVLLKLVLIVLLVTYHSFAPFSGSWKMPMVDYIDGGIYKLIAELSYSFMLESFVFLSGYILGFKMKHDPNSMTCNYLIFKKLKRLMLPCFIFGILYLFFFDICGVSIIQDIYKVVNGEGHLWFLPMLMWCFIAIFLFSKFNIPHWVCFLLAIIGALTPMVNIPFRINYSMTYFLFFYSGFFLAKEYNVQNLQLNGRILILILTAYLFFFFLFRSIDLYTIFASDTFLGKFSISFLTRLFRVVISSLGICFIYLISRKIIGKYGISNIMISISGLYFGVYIYQQFILKWLYYHTLFPEYFGKWFPFVGVFVTLLLSVVFSWLTINTRIGRMLIG